MKKYILLSIVVLFSSGLTLAQCNFAIPANAESVPVFAQKTNSHKSYWVCYGSGLTMTGNGNYLYIEDSASINVQGDSNYIYQRAHGSLTLSGNQNFVYYANTTTFTDNGGFTTATRCNQGMTFDYSNAPAGGCGIPAGISKLNSNSNMSIYPNPAKNVLNVELENIPQSTIACVVSVDGKRHSEFKLTRKLNVLDVSNLTSGIYYVEVKSNEGVYIERFVIE